jgi:uncharacterized protein (DUF2384 family)
MNMGVKLKVSSTAQHTSPHMMASKRRASEKKTEESTKRKTAKTEEVATSSVERFALRRARSEQVGVLERSKLIVDGILHNFTRVLSKTKILNKRTFQRRHEHKNLSDGQRERLSQAGD